MCDWTIGWELGVAGLLQVEFPEARIFEETLNILIYETPRGPDPAHLLPLETPAQLCLEKALCLLKFPVGVISVGGRTGAMFVESDSYF